MARFSRIILVALLLLITTAAIARDTTAVKERPKVGLVLSGGGAKGAAHIGVLKYIEEAGIPIAYWSVDTRDWESRNKDKILSVAYGKNGIGDGSIVLMHDIYKTTVEAAKEMILRLKKQGYTFVTTSELIEARRGGIVPGKQYS